MKFSILTLGCKVNTYESEVMKEKLLESGFLFRSNENESDIIIVNTCSVTNMADHKSMKMVRHAKRLGKIVVVCGCSSENKEELYHELDVDILLGNNEKSKIAVLLQNYLEKKEKYEKFYHTRNLPFEDMNVTQFRSLTRAFIKIQDGCNNFCSYCIIPYVRGSVRNKSFSSVLKEATCLVANGHKEIVLTGIHTGSYGSDGKNLAQLIHEMSKIQNLESIRISSIEVTELNEEMFEEIKNNTKIANHFHIPLQAGSDEILKKMNRKYNLTFFEKKINKLRQIRPDVSITTDVIVGHPFETDTLFEQTIETAKKIRFSKIHVFPYSKRDGTLASRMEEQVSEATKKERSRTLNQLSKELEKEYAVLFVGKTLQVLIEQIYDEFSLGTTSNYLKIKVYRNLERGNFYSVKVNRYENGVLIGEIIL